MACSLAFTEKEILDVRWYFSKIFIGCPQIRVVYDDLIDIDGAFSIQKSIKTYRTLGKDVELARYTLYDGYGEEMGEPSLRLSSKIEAAILAYTEYYFTRLYDEVETEAQAQEYLSGNCSNS